MYKSMIKELSDFLDNAQDIGYEWVIISATGYNIPVVDFSDILLKDTGLIIDAENMVGRVFIPYNNLLGVEVG